MSTLKVMQTAAPNQSIQFSGITFENTAKPSLSIFKDYSSVNIDKIQQNKKDNQKEPLTKLAQEDRENFINSLREEGIKYKENSDGSIEYKIDNTKIKDLWHGNKLTSQNKYPSKTILTYTMDLTTGKQNVTAINNKKNIKQEMTVNHDLTVENKNTYIKGKDGEFHKTDNFIGMDPLDGKFYTGSDIAKLFGTGQFNINSEEATHTFFNSITTDNIKTSLYENGTVVIEVDDGTTIKYIKKNENNKGIVQIEKYGILKEQYDTKGNPIK